MTPPPTGAPPCPRGIDEDVLPWLEHNGILPLSPRLRSSDYGLMRRCPRTWWLSRRMGLVPGLSESKALSRGSWVHAVLALVAEDPDQAQRRLAEALEVRLAEIDAWARGMGWTAERRREAMAREEQDYRCATGWCRLAVDMLPTADGHMIGSLFGPGGAYETLEVEPVVDVSIQASPTAAPAECTIQPDRVVRGKAGEVWIVDFKTTSMSVADRLQTCPMEFQTQHYFACAREAMAADHSRWGPPNKLAGVMHVALRKPTIEFGQNDRPFTLDTTPLKSGPRKGRPRNEKVYEGDPDPELYAQRCLDWFLGKGQYEHLAAERATDPCLGISRVSSGHLLDSGQFGEYLLRLRFMQQMRGRPPEPRHYEVGEVVSYHGKDPYQDFHLVEPGRWPEVVRVSGMVQQDRR